MELIKYKDMNIYEKLVNIQISLKAPKDQVAKVKTLKGDVYYYNYRNCENILEAVKPLCAKVGVVLILTDDIVTYGNRIYLKATAKLINIEKPEEVIEVTAFAREEETKARMDGSQITGASSSYARKYALNGLFNIDDTKDSDFTNREEEEKAPKTKKIANNKEEQADDKEHIECNVTKADLNRAMNVETKQGLLGDLSLEQLTEAMAVKNRLNEEQQKALPIVYKYRTGELIV